MKNYQPQNYQILTKSAQPKKFSYLKYNYYNYTKSYYRYILHGCCALSSQSVKINELKTGLQMAVCKTNYRSTNYRIYVLKQELLTIIAITSEVMCLSKQIPQQF
ncbi:Hypothetical_protein [Hexamita inflata]|uniref:Hypothetical_protein n=1 Tax=Hexamita inflata TaxID=28002 RepID=A0AA86RFG3_9EUKA|nr:Hypothetical protein HINF_LOCUS61378 [Hexamita inflata]